MLLSMRHNLDKDEPMIYPEIDTLFFIDRIVDPVTPLLTQLTYSGT
jgi:hypothetical protein